MQRSNSFLIYVTSAHVMSHYRNEYFHHSVQILCKGKGGGGGHNGHRGTKSRPNCERTYWLRVV